MANNTNLYLRPEPTVYNPSDFGKKEEELIRVFDLQREDARQYFEQCIKPRLDRSYKLYISYNGDRAKEIKSWQANVFVPYVNSVVETLMPRILDARPEFTAQGRTQDDQLKVKKLQQLTDFTWELAEGDKTSEDVTRASLVYGTGYLQVSWKKDVRNLKFLNENDLSKKKYTWEKREQVYYDAPYFEWVDNYNLWYDWHNTKAESKQYWFKRLLLTWPEIERRYPMADKKRMAIARGYPGGDLDDYATIRNTVKTTHERIVKGADAGQIGGISGNQIYNTNAFALLQMYEVFEWWRPFEDKYCVMVNRVPIMKGGEMPNPYDFKEAPFIHIPYLQIPGEFEGYGIPLLLENPQIMLNMIKNQRLDAATLNIHKMWIVNPLANVSKDELVTRPFGIIYSNDPNGVREVQFSDVKSSSYKEEELLKGDMRYASGVDDFSMGAGGNAGSATEVRHLRESTLERVRLYINHLGTAYSQVMRYWMSMYRQFYTEDMVIRITGDDGQTAFPLIEKDDLMGYFDYKATVLPSIAGMQDVKKKQDMDLFQLLINMPFVDPQKLTQKVLFDWNWDIDSISKGEEQGAIEGELPPPGLDQPPGELGGKSSLAKLRREAGGSYVTPFEELRSPVNLMESGPIPPTAPGLNDKAGQKTTNLRGHSRFAGGKVDTNIPQRQNSSPESNLMNQAMSTQPKKK